MKALDNRRRVLILCTGNSCRSQMAEGLIKHELGESWTAASAGTRPSDKVHPLAVEAMAEFGIDITGAEPTQADTLLDESWDLVITVCDSAKEVCPIFPRKVEQIHFGFPDPADATGTTEERMEFFREVRDAIRRELLPELRENS